MGAKERDLIFGQNWIAQLQDVRKRANYHPIGELTTNILSPSEILWSATLAPSTEQIKQRFRVRLAEFRIEIQRRNYYFLTR